MPEGSVKTTSTRSPPEERQTTPLEIGVYDIVRDGSGRFAKYVGDDSIKGDIADSEHITRGAPASFSLLFAP
jgi:hypothetical protein